MWGSCDCVSPVARVILALRPLVVPRPQAAPHETAPHDGYRTNSRDNTTRLPPSNFPAFFDLNIQTFGASLIITR